MARSESVRSLAWFGVAVLAGALASSSAASPPAQASLLPYDQTSLVLYDNDWTNDYIDWYLMALASAGDISYRGISTTSSLPPYNRHMPAADLDAQVRMRTDIVRAGRNSGFRNVPDPVPGPRGNLVRPASGRIEDTLPLDSAGSRAIVALARNATAARPIVVCLGGPLTAVADAYLLDPSIADKVVAAWTGGGFNHLSDYNGWADGWAAYIVLERMRLVQFPVHGSFFPRLTKQWIQGNLPESEAKATMLSLGLDVVNGSDGDADGMPAVSVRRPDYVQAVKRVSFAGWQTLDGHDIPYTRDDPNGRTIVVTQASGAIASQEYQRALSNPSAWGGAPPPPPPGGDLLGHWRLDEGGGTFAEDASGNGNHGTLMSGASWTGGVEGGALSLDGVDDGLEVPDSPSLSVTGAVTVALWFRYGGRGGGWDRIAVKDWGQAQAPWLAYGLTLDDGPEGGQKVLFSANGSATQGAGVSSMSFPVAGEWTHLAGVYDPAAGTVALYVNGVRESDAAASFGAVVDSPGPFLVGRASWGHPLQGAVDDVRVYGRALSAAEIAALADPQAAGGGTTPPPPGGREGSNGDGGLNDSMCGALGIEVLLLLALVRPFRRR